MEELDLKDLFNLFLSKIFQIILIVIIATGIGVVYTMGFTTPKYTSSKTLTNIILDTNLSKFKTILFAKFPIIFFNEFNVRKITTNQFYI